MNEDQIGRPFEILLVDDNPGDVRLTVEALKESKVRNVLNVVCDGIEAINYLRRIGKYKDATRPDIMLLDLNLPKKDGREVLKDFKNDDALKDIPVVVLTTSESEQDIMKAYNNHANCFIKKPVDFEEFVNIIKSIEHFWFNVAKLPRKD